MVDEDSLENSSAEDAGPTSEIPHVEAEVVEEASVVPLEARALPPLIEPTIVSEEPPMANAAAPTSARGANAGAPAVEVTAKTSMSAAQAAAAFDPAGFLRNVTPAASRAQQGCIEYIEQVRKSAQSANFRMQVIRKRPAVWQEYDLCAGSVIDDRPMMAYPDLVSYVEEMHGGGEYELRIVNSSGAPVNSMVFSVDIGRYEPRVPMNARRRTTVELNVSHLHPAGRVPMLPGGGSGVGRFGPGAAFGGLLEENEETIDLRNQERKLVAKKQALRAQQEVVELERKIEEMNDKHEEQKMFKSRAPVDEVKREVEEVKKEFSNKFDRLLDTLAYTNNNNKGDDKTIALIVESIRAQAAQATEAQKANATVAAETAKVTAQAQAENMKLILTLFTTMMTMQSNKPQSSEAVDAMKMLVEMSMKQGSEAREIANTLILKAANSPQDQVKQMLDLMSRGREDAMAMMELMQGNGPAEPITDPENGFFSNLGNLLLYGAQRAVDGLARGGGNKLAGAAARLFAPAPLGPGAPVGPTITVPAAHVSVAPALPVAEVAPRALPAPVPQPRVAAPVRNADGTSLVLGYYDAVVDEATGAVLEQAVPREEAMTSAPVAPAPEEVASLESAAPSSVSGISESLREHVTEAMRIACDDLDNGRVAPDWTTYAGEKWGRFLQQLAQATDDATRTQLIFEACDADVYQELHARLSIAANRAKFAQDTRAMIAEYAGAVGV